MTGASINRAKPPSKSSVKSKPVKPAVGSSSHFTKAVTARSARGRSKASGRAVRVPPSPSYQLHPDPERYQQLQQALADRGYFKGEVNGTWGDDSIDALRKFQTDQKLPDDGKITALSLTALGLGPRHDGSTASTVPLPPVTPESSPSVATPQSTSPPELPH